MQAWELVSIVSEELWTKVCNTVQESANKATPKENKKAQWLSEEALQKAKEGRGSTSQGEGEK